MFISSEVREIKTKRIISILVVMVMVFGILGLANIVEASQGNEINLNLKGVDLRDAFRAIAEIGGMNVITDTSVSGEVTINLRNISFFEAMELLAKTNGLGYKMVNDTILIGSPESLESGFGNRVTQVYILENADPREVKETLDLLVEPESIRVDNRTNSVIVTTYDSRLAEIDHIVESLDRIKKQVALQVRVIELNYGVSEEIGFNWTIDESEDDDSSALEWSEDHRVQASSISEDFDLKIGNLSLSRSGISYDSFFKALETNNLGSTLANPRISTLDGKRATINIGEEIPIVNRDDDGNRMVEFKNVGINLDITPRITENDEVFISVIPEVSDFTGWVDSGGYRYPIISTKRAETNIRVKDGETFALGGLIDEKEFENKRKVPILGDIPLMGRLFRSKTTSTDKKEVIIFITPEIIPAERASVEEIIDEDYLDIFSYRVRSHDTLWGIGELFGISYIDLMEYNNIEEVTKIEVGRVLSIPVDSRQYYRGKLRRYLRECCQ